MTTLNYNSVSIALPDDLLWSDEYSWQPVEQKKARTITGVLVAESRSKIGGRPMTLQGTQDSGLAARSVVDALVTAASIAGQLFTLTGFRGANYSVAFDHEQKPFEATPWIDYSDPASTDLYLLTLRMYLP